MRHDGAGRRLLFRTLRRGDALKEFRVKFDKETGFRRKRGCEKGLRRQRGPVACSFAAK